MEELVTITYEEWDYDIPKSLHPLISSCIDMLDSLRGEQRCEEELQKALGHPVYNSMLNMIRVIEKEISVYNILQP